MIPKKYFPPCMRHIIDHSMTSMRSIFVLTIFLKQIGYDTESIKKLILCDSHGVKLMGGATKKLEVMIDSAIAKDNELKVPMECSYSATCGMCFDKKRLCKKVSSPMDFAITMANDEKRTEKIMTVLGTIEGMPIIETVPREDFPRGQKFFCPFCNRWHYHGEGEGSRSPHCVQAGSMLKGNQYYITLRGTPLPDKATPNEETFFRVGTRVYRSGGRAEMIDDIEKQSN